VAWGLRNPFGLAFHEGRLFVTENGFDARGSRPVITKGDHLWEIEPGSWYGWPDFDGGEPLKTAGPGDEAPAPLLAKHPQTPPEAVAVFGVHSSADRIAFPPNDAFGYAGKAFVAQFGDMTPMTGATSSRVGFKVVTVDVGTGQITGFATNKGPVNGPAQALNTKGFERPVGVTFSRDGKSLYVVDFGTLYMTPMGPSPKQNSGVVWKITRQ
jgi:glucose/arabinose dehydrogenase